MNKTLLLSTFLTLSIAVLLLATSGGGCDSCDANAKKAELFALPPRRDGQSRGPVTPRFQTKYQLPQYGFGKNSPWAKVSQSFQLDQNNPGGWLIPWYDSVAHKQSICSGYNTPFAPRSPQDCPDSSFTYVTDMSKFIKGQTGPGCIQLGMDSQNYCYSDKKGAYHPWWDKIGVTTP